MSACVKGYNVDVRWSPAENLDLEFRAPSLNQCGCSEFQSLSLVLENWIRPAAKRSTHIRLPRQICRKYLQGRSLKNN